MSTPATHPPTIKHRRKCDDCLKLKAAIVRCPHCGGATYTACYEAIHQNTLFQPPSNIPRVSGDDEQTSLEAEK